MASFGKKKKFTEYLYSRPSIALLAVIIVFLSIAVFQRFTVERQMALRKLEIEAQRQELMERKALLENRVDYLSGDRGIEEEIRKHFDVAKEGEQVVIIVDKEVPPVSETKKEPEKKPWYKFW
jgi:hypothetical protein